MHHGPGIFLRQYLEFAKPWQRLAGGIAFAALGAYLVARGQYVGLLPGLLGCAMVVRTVAGWLRYAASRRGADPTLLRTARALLRTTTTTPHLDRLGPARTPAFGRVQRAVVAAPCGVPHPRHWR